jgi:hypothetical protein
MKKALLLSTLIIAIFISVFIQTECQKAPSPEEIKASLEIVDLDTKWVKKYYQPWPPKLTLVPAISFRVKNLTEDTIRYISFEAVFRFMDETETLGEGFLPGVPGGSIPPGETSDTILLKSSLGVEGKSVSHFRNSPYWKTALVKLYVQSKGSRFALLGEWEVSRKIDFKEPQPYPPKKEEKLASY